MASAGTVTLELDANSVKLIRELQKAQKQTKRSTGTMAADARKAFSSMKDNAIATAKALTGIGLAAAASAAAIVRSTTRTANEIQVLSRTANTSVGDFQRMAFAANQFGIGNEKLSDILKDVTDRVGDFIQTGGGPMADFFEKIAPKVGVTADQFTKLSGRDALQLYVSSLEKANLSQADMVFYMEAMASDSVRLLPLLTNNGKAAGEFADQADRLGIVLSEIDIASIEKARMEMASAQEVGRIYANQFTVGISTSLAALARMFTQSREGAASIAEQVNNISVAVVTGTINMGASVAEVMQPVMRMVAATWEAFKSLPAWAQELGVLGSFLFGKKGIAVVATVAALQKQVDDLIQSTKSPMDKMFGGKVDTGARKELEMINLELEKRKKVQMGIAPLSDTLKLMTSGSLTGMVFGTDEELKDRAGKLMDMIDQMQLTYNDAMKGGFTVGVGQDEDKSFSIIDAMFGGDDSDIRKKAQSFIDEYTATMATINAELAASVQQPMEQIAEIAEVAIVEVDKVAEEAKKPFDQMTEFGKAAAQNLQTSFADFLFDPFENGIKGMLASFANLIRRMIAEAAAAKILQQLFGGLAGSSNAFLSSIGNAFVGPAAGAEVPGVRDVGGRGEAGKPYVINPKAGPEIFIPTTAGEFIPNIDEMGGGTNLSLTIDARDAGAEARIKDMIIREMVPQIISAAKQDTIKTLRRPRFA